MEKRTACFIQGDRPEAGAELAMTDRELAHLFCVSPKATPKNYRSMFDVLGAML